MTTENIWLWLKHSIFVQRVAASYKLPKEKCVHHHHLTLLRLCVIDQDTKWDSFMNNFCSGLISAFPKKQMKTDKVPPYLFYAYTLGDVVSTSKWSHLRSTDTEQAKGISLEEVVLSKWSTSSISMRHHMELDCCVR